MMNKNGQYYLIIVVIMCIAIFSLLSITTSSRTKTRDVFKELWENCYKESTYVFNQAVKNNKNIFTESQTFALNFKEYSKTIDSSFGFIFLATNIAGETRTTNLLESDISVQADTEDSSDPISKGNYITEDTDYVNITINDIKYDFETTRKPNIQFLFWQQKDNTIRVKQK